MALYHVADGSLAWHVPLAAGLPERLVFLGSGMGLVAVGKTKAVVHAVMTGKPAEPWALPAPLVDVDSSPDGTVLAGITGQGVLVRITTADGSARSAPDAAPDTGTEFYSLTPSADGRFLAASAGTTVKSGLKFVSVWIAEA